MHDLSPILRTLLTGFSVFAGFMAFLLAWAAFVLDGAGKTDLAGAMLLVASVSGVGAGMILRMVWGK